MPRALTDVIVTRNEILTCLNQPDLFHLAIVEVDGETAAAPLFLRAPFRKDPDPSQTAAIYSIAKLMAAALEVA